LIATSTTAAIASTPFLDTSGIGLLTVAAYPRY
jgi:hypothetical protein